MSYFIIYECDMFHTQDSYKFRGLYDDFDTARDAVAECFQHMYRDEVKGQLDQWSQTQGYDPNFIIEEHELNVWEN